MFDNHPSRFAMLLIGVVTVFLASGPVAAEIPWLVRGGGTLAITDGRSDQSVGGGQQRTNIPDDDFGFTLTTEVLVHERVGLEFGALLIVSPEITVDIADRSGIFEARDSMDLTVIGAGVNFHLTPAWPVDLFVGPFIGHAVADNLSFDTPDGLAAFRVDTELVLGGVIGLDVPLSESWSLSGSARYMALELDLEGAEGPAESIPLDPVTFTLGVALHF